MPPSQGNRCGSKTPHIYLMHIYYIQLPAKNQDNCGYLNYVSAIKNQKEKDPGKRWVFMLFR